ncbi:YqzE family protein [Oceanobacillus chungangensis]|uniref:YqzE family protein n=1 Tax=Oceanobacillus chungangensis TaxID=1229152 RepID=A0A3D8Q257_9BACI|nr:YqzE family protein [Oceanobacillus chungangensis]RDW21937.1 YqzE family protein [Oceanobacillus chungangensis]
MKSNEYVKFMTQQIVTYMELPMEERKKRKLEQKNPSIYANHWLGVLPFALRVMRKKAE